MTRQEIEQAHKRLCEFWEKSKKSNQKVSDETGLSINAVTKIHNGSTESPGLNSFILICECIGATLGDIFPDKKLFPDDMTLNAVSKTEDAPAFVNNAITRAKAKEILFGTMPPSFELLKIYCSAISDEVILSDLLPIAQRLANQNKQL